MSLEDLNHSVTIAILRAEALPRGSWEAERAFRAVADIEEEISAIVGAQSVEGEAARLGAVTAALGAGEPLRAAQLAGRYLADALSDGSLAKLRELLDEANSQIESTSAGVPNVHPIRFSLPAA